MILELVFTTLKLPITATWRFGSNKKSLKVKLYLIFRQIIVTEIFQSVKIDSSVILLVFGFFIILEYYYW